LLANLMETRKHRTPTKTGTEKTRAIRMIEQQNCRRELGMNKPRLQADFSMSSETCKSYWSAGSKFGAFPLPADLSLFRPPFSNFAATSIKAVARFAVEAKFKKYSPYPSDNIGLKPLLRASARSVDNKALTGSHIRGLSNQIVTTIGLRRAKVGRYMGERLAAMFTRCAATA